VVRLCFTGFTGFTGVRLCAGVRLETLRFGVMLCAEVPLDLLLLAVRAVEEA
jgi:hypothetical protein